MLITTSQDIPQIITDFDGIFAHSMTYNNKEKCMKTFGFGVRHAFELLKAVGFPPPIIITGDATGNGAEITKKFLHNIPHEMIRVKSHHKTAYIRRNFPDKSYLFVGEDIYDIDLAKYARHYFTIKENEVLEKYSFMSFKQNYFWLSFAEWMIRRYTSVTIKEVQRLVAQPDLIKCIHEEIQQYACKHKLDLTNITEFPVNVFALNSTMKNLYGSIVSDVLNRYCPNNDATLTYMSSTPGKGMFNLFVDMIPSEAVDMLTANTVPSIVVLHEFNKDVAKRLRSLSESFRESNRMQDNCRFYYGSSETAYKYEIELQRTTLVRTILPKHIGDVSDTSDTYLPVQNPQFNSIQLTLPLE